MARADELIVQVLEEAGVDHLFGIPGGGTGQIFVSLQGGQGKTRTVLVRHEQAAAIMADAYGRATGKPAAIMGQGGFMGSNASFGIMEAFLSSSPMLVLTDTSDGGVAQHPANQSGAGEYGSIDLPNIFRSMTKYTALATTAKEAVLGTQLALKHATGGRPGPACVLMRSSSIVGEVDMESPPFIHHTSGYLNTSKPQASPQDVEKAVDLLRNASRPVLVVGNGVHIARAYSQVRELAELWGMPVATSYKGKSVIEETHPLSVGMVGVYGQRAANAVVGEADVVLVAGARLSSQETVRERPQVFDPRRQRIIQIDIDARNTGWTFPVELGLVGDAGSVLSQILEASGALAPQVQDRARERRLHVQATKDRLGFYHDPELFQDSSPVMPQRPGAPPPGDPCPREPDRPGSREQPDLDVPPLPGPAHRHLLLPRRDGGHGLELAGFPGPEAGPARRAGGVGDGRRRVHDVGPRSVHRDAVRPSNTVRGAERLGPGHGAPPPGGDQDRLGVPGDGQWRRGPGLRRLWSPGTGLEEPAPGHPGRPGFGPARRRGRGHRPGPQPRRLPGRHALRHGNLGSPVSKREGLARRARRAAQPRRR